MTFTAHKLPHLIFLHGWGQSPQIWHHQINYFSQLTQTSTIKLPGHGGATNVAAQDWLKHIQQQIDNEMKTDHNFILVAWSLGGQIALSLASALQQQKQCKGLALIATTPCFRKQPDWAYGCADDVWHGFCEAATTGDVKIMQRFFRLMLHGDNLSRQAYKTLAHTAINQLQPPTLAGLNAGLNLLSSLDARPMLNHIKANVLILHGKNDAIVPVEAGRYLASHIQHAAYDEFDDCGHAPFLTHDTAFNQTLELWWKNLSA